jgi:hypothetical protein
MRFNNLVLVTLAGAVVGSLGTGCGEARGARSKVKANEIAADFPWEEEEGEAVEARDLRPAEDPKKRSLLIERGRDVDEVVLEEIEVEDGNASGGVHVRGDDAGEIADAPVTDDEGEVVADEPDEHEDLEEKVDDDGKQAEEAELL